MDRSLNEIGETGLLKSERDSLWEHVCFGSGRDLSPLRHPRTIDFQVNFLRTILQYLLKAYLGFWQKLVMCVDIYICIKMQPLWGWSMLA